MGAAVVVARHAALPEPQEQFAARGELEHGVVTGLVAEDPEIAVAVDFEPFEAVGPLAHATDGRDVLGAAPGRDEIPVGVESDD